MNLKKTILFLLITGVSLRLLGQNNPNLKVSGGHDYSVGICADGTVKAWGSNTANQIPGFAGTTTDNPTVVSGLPAIQAVDAGSGAHAVALACNGEVWTWGRNSSGQLGNGNVNPSTVPVQTLGIGGTGVLTGVSLVSGGTDETFAIMSDGRLVGWGENDFGQLASGNTTDRLFPGYVMTRWDEGASAVVPATILENVIMVEAGDQSATALVDPDGDGIGTVYSWGENGGDGGVPIGRDAGIGGYLYAMPVVTSSGQPLNNIVQIAGGDQHGAAIDVNGNVWSWGGDWGRGQLGDGPTYGFNLFATQVVGGESGEAFLGDNDPVISIAAGQAHSIAATQSGAIYSWGANGLYIGANVTPSGLLGIGNNLMTVAAIEVDNSLSSSPVRGLVSAGNPLQNVVSVSDGDGWSFAVTADNRIYVAGYNVNGELGLNNGSFTNELYFTEMSMGCPLDEECPIPFLGPDLEVCTGFTPFDLNAGALTSNFSYTWYKNGVVIPGETGASLTVSDTGTYIAVLNDNRTTYPCTQCSGSDTVVLSLPVAPFSDPGGLTYCGANLTTANVNGTGSFVWYANATGGSPLATSTNNNNINASIPVSSLNTVSGTVKEIYVEDISSLSTTVVTDAAITASGIRDYNESYQNRLSFSITQGFTLNQVTAFVRGYGSSDVQVLNLYTSGGALVASSSVTTTHDGSQAFDFDFTNADLTAGDYYFESIDIQAYATAGNAFATYGPTQFHNLVTVVDNGVDQAAFLAITDWDIDIGNAYPCGRLRVLVDELCTCTSPGTVTLTRTGAENQCNGPVLLTATTTGTPPAGGFEFEFRSTPGDAVVQAASSTNTFSATTSGSIYVVVTDPADASTCTGQSAPVVVGIDVPPTASNAGTNQTICANHGTLAGNAPVIGSGLWSLVSGTGTLTSPGSPSSTVTGLGVGANVFQWTISNGACPDESSQVTITIDEAPSTANAGVNQTLCADQVTLAANTPSVGTGTWSLISGAGTIASANSPSSTVTGLGVGANVFEWTVSNGVCPDETSQVTIMRDEAPSSSTAGTNQTICSDQVTLGANVPGVGTGVWSLVSGTGMITSVNSPSSTVTGLGVGTNVFEWAISNGVCPDETSQVTITRDEAPSASTAGMNQTICTDQVTLGANVPGVGAGAWTLVSGTGTVVSVNSASSTVTGLGVGANVFEWAISNGVCPDEISQVTITRDEAPSFSDPGLNQTICANQVTLSGNTPAVGSGTWTVISGGASIADPTLPGAIVTGLIQGSNTFRWTISNGVCPDESNDVTITRDGSTSVSDAGPDQTICATQTTFVGNTPIIGTGVWTLVAGSGTITTNTDPSSQVTGLGVGANVFRWTISNGTCPDETSEVTITRDEAPSVSNAGVNETICLDQVILAGNTPVVGVGSWSLVSGSGTISSVNDPSSAVTALATGANTFRWTISNGVCPDEVSEVIITRDEAPSIADAGLDQTICSDQVTLAGNTPAVGTGSWSLVSGTGTMADASLPASVVANLGIGVNVFQWTISNGVCANEISTVAITRDEEPTIAQVGLGGNVCIADPIQLAANNPTIGIGAWSLGSATTGGIIADILDPQSMVNGMLDGDVLEAIWTVTNGVCPASADTLTFVATGIADPALQLSASVDVLCEGESVRFTALGSNGGTNPVYTFFYEDGTQIQSGSDFELNLSPGASISVYAELLSNSSCVSGSPLAYSDTLTVGVDLVPTPSSAVPDQVVCSDNVVLSGNTPAVGTGTWTGGGTIANPNNPSSSVSGLSYGDNLFVWTIANGVCPLSQSQVTISRADDLTIPDVIGQSTTLCTSNSSITLGGTPLNAAAIPAETAHWTSIEGVLLSPSGNNALVGALSPGVFQFVYEITNGVCTPLTDTVTLQVDGEPSAAIILEGDQMDVCGDTVTITAQQLMVGQGSWSTSPAITIADPLSPALWVSGITNGSILATWTVANGVCSNKSSTIAIHPVDQLTPLVDILPGDLTLCRGSMQDFDSDPVNGGPSPQFEWRMNGVPLGNGNSLTQAINESCWLSLQMISNAACLTDSLAEDSIWIVVEDRPSPTITAEGGVFCEGDLVQVEATLSVGGELTWHQLGEGTMNEGTTSLTVNTTGSYYVEEETSLCGSGYSDTVAVIISPYPIVDAGDDQEIALGETVYFQPSVSFGDVNWSSQSLDILDANILDAETTPEIGGIHVAVLTADNEGCITEDSLRITVLLPVEIPNTFTPNGDDINEVFLIRGLETYPNAYLQVFNRWGHLVYDRYNPHGAWWDGTRKGKDLPSATYYYVLQLNDQESREFSGDITLIR